MWLGKFCHMLQIFFKTWKKTQRLIGMEKRMKIQKYVLLSIETFSKEESSGFLAELTHTVTYMAD